MTAHAKQSDVPTAFAQSFSHWPSWPVPHGISLPVLSPHECPYLPGREARSRAFMIENLPATVYDELMDAGFRRSGKLVYQPACEGCRECRPIRVVTEAFKPSKSQRKALNRNADLTVTPEANRLTDEKFELYRRYYAQWHGRDDHSREDLERFLYDSPVHTIDMLYRDGTGKLLGVGVCDVSPLTFSSVYFYFDPAEKRRSLGTFGAITEIRRAAQLHLRHYYLGYWIPGCGQMAYKNRFKPYEILHTDGIWRSSGDDERHVEFNAANGQSPGVPHARTR
ncbi:MAG: arginyltransferase [Planctomycetota bacterium]